MPVDPAHLPRLCELSASTAPEERAQAWDLVATLTEGDTCPGCGAVLDPDEDVTDAPEDGTGWHYDVTAWFHVCAPGSPMLRAQ